MRQQGEASVEEILESIKKVIAQDNRAGAMAARRRREGSVSADAPVDAVAPDEVLELDHEAMVADQAEVRFAGDDASDDDGLGDDGLGPDGLGDDGALLNDTVRGAMRDNLAALAMLAEPGAPPQIVRSGETSLEGLVREMLRPMLAQWLDTNLPGMVERLVKQEIARIAGKRG